MTRTELSAKSDVLSWAQTEERLYSQVLVAVSSMQATWFKRALALVMLCVDTLISWLFAESIVMIGGSFSI